MMPDSGRFDGAEHVYGLRVYYEDTDAAGVVYYADYLRMAERARIEMMRLLGAGHAAMAAEHGLMLAVRECSVEYFAPARLDDIVEIRSRLTGTGGASIRLEQVFRRGTTELARLRLRLGCVGGARQPARLPSSVRAALARLESDFMPAQKQRA